jgi:calcium/calmodulin-dependent protein kinase I
MTHHNPIVQKVLALFKKTHSDDDNSQYPADLRAKYTVSEKTLGVGSFAVVKECEDVKSGEKCAVKIILKKAIAGKVYIIKYIL